MNLLFVSPTFPPERGGAESLFDDLVRLACDAGHRATVLAEAPEASAPGEIGHGDARVLRLRYPRASRHPTRLARFLRDAARLSRRHRRWLREGAVDCVVVARLDEKAAYLLRPPALRRHRQVVYLHGAELRRFAREQRRARLLLRFALASSDAVVAVSEALGREARALAPGAAARIAHVPNAIDVSRIRATAPAVRPRPFVLYAGRLSRVKNPELALRAFAACADTLPHLDLVLAGGGEDRDALVALAGALGLEGRAHFAGALDRERVWGLLRAAELVVVPSLAEGHPLVVLEAQAAGRMVLASDVKGLRSAVEDGVTGALFDPRSPDALAAALVRYAADPAARAGVEARLAARDLSASDLRLRFDEHLRLWRGDG